MSKRETETEGGRESERVVCGEKECCYIHTLSWGVCVMKTGHSRAVGTVGAFTGVSDTPVLDICSAREAKEQGSPGSDLTKAVTWSE